MIAVSARAIPAPNRPLVGIATIDDAHGGGVWHHRLIENAQTYADLLREAPGSVTAPVWRPNADEFVAILDGRYEVEIDDHGTFVAEADTYICVPKGHAARFHVLGGSHGVRTSVRQPNAQSLPADRRTPAERRSAHSVIPTVQVIEEAPGNLTPNRVRLTLADLKLVRGEANWAHRVMDNETFMTNLIYMKPHDLPAGHWHADCDEWWMIREGTIEWVFDGIGTHQASRGDFVCAPRGYLHRIHVIGDVPGIRMPSVLPNVPHPGPDVLGYARRGIPGFP